MSAVQSLSSRVLQTKPIRWRDLKFIQSDDFKHLDEEAYNKLVASILSNQFTQPFYVWHDSETNELYCLDGRHRVLVLENLVAQGYDVPDELPATFIYCKDKKEAAHLVLIYSSMYAKITQQGLFDFIQAYDIDYAAMRDQVDMPDFSTDRFEQKFDVFHVAGDQDNYEVEEDPAEAIVVKTGDLFQLGDHRVICGSFLEPGVRSSLLLGEQARILICDPPYNLPANFFLKDNAAKHKDFAMGAGEMTDEEFASFLESIMHAAKVHTVPGAIHYIFMDHRHGWHMCEAARRVYGSPIPKQLCTWVKDIMANGSFYRAQQELCFVFADPGTQALWNRDLVDEGGFYKTGNELCYIFKNGEGAKHLSHLDLADRIRTNVWRYPSSNSRANPDRLELKNHPTPKPVRMIADAILDTTNPGDGVIDWFLGSGTALIAAVKTGRRCFGTEIEPKFVQSIVKRYISYCRKTGTDIIFKHENGSPELKDFLHE